MSCCDNPSLGPMHSSDSPIDEDAGQCILVGCSNCGFIDDTMHACSWESYAEMKELLNEDLQLTKENIMSSKRNLALTLAACISNALVGVLLVVFTVLKLSGVVSWPWVLVLSPLWIALICYGCAGIITLILLYVLFNRN